MISKLLKLILLPFMALTSIIFYLLQKNQGLKDDLNSERAGREMDQINNDIKGAKNEADKAEADYAAARAKYLAERDGTDKV